MVKKESPEKRAKRKKLAESFAEKLEKRKKPGFQRYGENHKNQ